MKASQNSGRKSLGEIEKSNHLTASTGDTFASWGLAAQILDGFYVAGGSPECARPGDLQIHRRRADVEIRCSQAVLRQAVYAAKAGSQGPVTSLGRHASTKGLAVHFRHGMG